MKKWTIILLLICSSMGACAQGINFYEGFSWEELKEKAKKERKYIFVDAFTTWCGPCKMMDEQVYNVQRVGDRFNPNFISVKVQMDKTKADSKEVQDWYFTAKELEKRYGINAYPTMLFISPQGELLSKVVGAKGTDDLIKEVDLALDPKRQYSNLMKAYEQGERQPALVRALARSAKENGDVEKAYNIANDYLNGLTDKQLYEEENVQFAGDFLRTSKDRGFNLFYKDWPIASKYIANKDFGPGIVGQIIYFENVHPYLETANGKPDYDRIKANLKLYQETGDDVWKRYHFYVFNTYELKPLLRTYPNWNDLVAKILNENLGDDEASAYISIVNYYNNGISAGNAIQNLINAIKVLQGKYPKRVTPALLNSAAYQVFNASLHKSELESALNWSKQVTGKENDPGYLDTYAGLLYKLGRTEEAISVQQRAVEKAGGAKEFKATLDKMRAGRKLGWDFGNQMKATGSRIDFNGEWAIDSLRGEFSGMTVAKAAPLKLSLKQSSNAIEILRNFVGSPSKPEEMTFDGKSLSLDLPETKVKRQLIWSQDSSILTIFSTYKVTPPEGQPWEYSREETFTLMDDGKSLLWSRITIMPGKVDNVKAIYRKQ